MQLCNLGQVTYLLWALCSLSGKMGTLHGNIGEVNWIEIVHQMSRDDVLLYLEVLQSEGVIKH